MSLSIRQGRSGSHAVVGPTDTDHGFYVVGHLSDWLVLPVSENGPSLLAKQLAGLSVSPPIVGDLDSPELGVGFRDGVVVGAPVPEATVYEDRHPASREEDVRGSSKRGFRSSVDKEAEPPRMKLASDGQFGLGVAAAIGPHARSNPWRRGPGRRIVHMFDTSGGSAPFTSRRQISWRP